MRAAVVLFSSYPSDPRPCRAAEALAEEGAVIDVICLRADKSEPRKQSFGRINVFRVPIKHRRGGKFAYAMQYVSFIAVAFLLLSFRAITRRYKIVHIHNMPDVLVFSAIVPRMLGAKIILDLHDPMPELMMTIFNLRGDSISVRFLQKLEKFSVAFAHLVLTVNLASKRIFASRSCSPGKIHVIMNSPDENIFRYRPVDGDMALTRDPNEPLVIMYHGSLVERNGVDLAVNALCVVKKSIPTGRVEDLRRAHSVPGACDALGPIPWFAARRPILRGADSRSNRGCDRRVRCRNHPESSQHVYRNEHAHPHL